MSFIQSFARIVTSAVIDSTRAVQQAGIDTQAGYREALALRKPAKATSDIKSTLEAAPCPNV